ncbi:circumsporozoite- and TRAP-related protein, putative, partial [Hepatocystis sp. ex Piliocolobus tephrosceles]
DNVLSTTEIQNDYICKQYPENAQCAEWGEWSDCPYSGKCRHYYSKRVRNENIFTIKEAEINDQGVGSDCNDLGSNVEYRGCPLRDIDCIDFCGEFGEWSECSASCGGGIRIKTRKFLESNKTCKNADLTLIESCNVQSCDVIETCKDIGEWGEWSSCSKPCGYSTRERNFMILDSDIVQHPHCADYKKKETMVCSVPSCDDEKCFEWEDWDEWSGPCGTRKRVQRARLLGNNGNKNYSHEGQNENSCEDSYENKVEYDEGEPCGIDMCGHWLEWSACNKTCGVGVRFRRFISHIPTLSGGENDVCLDYMNLTETEPCLNLPLCHPGECNEWETFVSCEDLEKESTSCHIPKKTILTRKLDLLTHKKENVPEECVDYGYFKEEECKNTVSKCNNNAVCNEWEEWGDCSEPCGTSTKSRRRKEPLELIPATVDSNGKMGLTCLEQHLTVEETNVCEVPMCLSTEPELEDGPNDDNERKHRSKITQRVTLGAGIIGLILLAGGGVVYGYNALNGGEKPDSSNMEFENVENDIGDQEVNEDFEVIDANDPMWN